MNNIFVKVAKKDVHESFSQSDLFKAIMSEDVVV